MFKYIWEQQVTFQLIKVTWHNVRIQTLQDKVFLILSRVLTVSRQVAPKRQSGIESSTSVE